MKLNKQAVLNAFKGLQKSAKQHSPEILTGLGIAGMITAAVVAVRTTPKALALIEEKEIDEGRNLTNGEKFKTVWTCYIPPVVVGTASVACLVGSTSVSLRRNAALAAAYSIAETSLKDYTEKTLELVGEKKEQQIRDAVAQDKLEKDPVTSKEVIMTDAGETLCYDVLSGRYFRSDMETIRKAVNDLNMRMRNEMYISLNDFYYEIGLPANQLGECLGWNIEKGEIAPDFGSHLAKDGTPCLVIAHKSAPRYGFDVLSMP